LSTQKSLFQLAEENENKTFDEIIGNQDVRNQFVKQVEYLAQEKAKITRLQDGFKGDVDATHEAFKINKSELNKIIDSVLKDKVEDNLTVAIRLADTLELFKHNVDGEYVNE